MAILIPNPMTGRDVAFCKLTVQSVTTAGVMTDASPAHFALLQDSTGDPYSGGSPPPEITITLSLLANVELVLDARTQDISGINRLYANHVRVGIGTGFIVEEILRKATDSQRLASIYYNGVSPYVKAEFARANIIWTFYGVMKNLGGSHAQGRNTDRLVCGPVGLAPVRTAGVHP